MRYTLSYTVKRCLTSREFFLWTLKGFFRDLISDKILVADVKHPIDMDGSFNKKVLYCYNCGAGVRDVKYCSGCGSRLKWVGQGGVRIGVRSRKLPRR